MCYGKLHKIGPTCALLKKNAMYKYSNFKLNYIDLNINTSNGERPKL